MIHSKVDNLEYPCVFSLLDAFFEYKKKRLWPILSAEQSVLTVSSGQFLINNSHILITIIKIAISLQMKQIFL